jgi:hypothetical protein
LRNSKILEIALEKGEKEKKKITILLSTTWKQPQMEVYKIGKFLNIALIQNI